MNVSVETFTILQMLRWPRIGPATVRKVVAQAPTGEDLLSFAIEKLQVSVEAVRQAEREAHEAIEQCQKYDVSMLGLLDPGYSVCLAHIDDCPPVIFIKGSRDNLHARAVAVVGTRRASEAGLRIARTIAGFLVTKDCVVVSGLALGIDSAAHRGALDANGRTVAVLAHGLDHISPGSNRALAQEILDKGGTLLSEHPPGFPARPAEFVRRNRIQSGLSVGSVIVESDVEGGAIHQATFTRRQGRHLMVVLAASAEARAELNEAGARHLVATLGAAAISSTRDLFRELQSGPTASTPAQVCEKQVGLEW